MVDVKLDFKNIKQIFLKKKNIDKTRKIKKKTVLENNSRSLREKKITL